MGRMKLAATSTHACPWRAEATEGQGPPRGLRPACCPARGPASFPASSRRAIPPSSQWCRPASAGSTRSSMTAIACRHIWRRGGPRCWPAAASTGPAACDPWSRPSRNCPQLELHFHLLDEACRQGRHRLQPQGRARCTAFWPRSSHLIGTPCCSAALDVPWRYTWRSSRGLSLSWQ